MTQHDRQLRRCDLIVAEMQVGPAYSACLDRDAELPRTGLWVGQLGGSQRLTLGFEDRGAHCG
jgi:hypothetical protein